MKMIKKRLTKEDSFKYNFKKRKYFYFFFNFYILTNLYI